MTDTTKVGDAFFNFLCSNVVVGGTANGAKITVTDVRFGYSKTFPDPGINYTLEWDPVTSTVYARMDRKDVRRFLRAIEPNPIRRWIMRHH